LMTRSCAMISGVRPRIASNLGSICSSPYAGSLAQA
jgi:hypothetical protein